MWDWLREVRFGSYCVKQLLHERLARVAEEVIELICSVLKSATSVNKLTLAHSTSVQLCFAVSPSVKSAITNSAKTSGSASQLNVS